MGLEVIGCINREIQDIIDEGGGVFMLAMVLIVETGMDVIGECVIAADDA